MTLSWTTFTFEQLSLEQLYEILRLREAVFSVEQECIYTDLDGLDQGATHLLCEDQGSLLAYLRCLPPGLAYPQSSMGRIVVPAQSRGTQLGRELVRRGVELTLAQWPDSDVIINAQAYLRRFYEGFGFSAMGEEYIFDGIPHLKMLRKS